MLPPHKEPNKPKSTSKSKQSKDCLAQLSLLNKNWLNLNDREHMICQVILNIQDLQTFQMPSGFEQRFCITQVLVSRA